MTTKTDFTTEEWDALLSGPLAASMYIIIASPSVFGSIKEMTTMSKELAAAALRPDNTELLRFLLADYKDKDTLKRVTPNVKGKQDEVMAAIRGYVSAAVALLNEKAAPEESAQIRQWMYDLAVKVAESAKEGGFLGMGAVRVSDAEKKALAELADILGVSKASAEEETAPEEDAPAEVSEADADGEEAAV
jgi:hypothetical protein